MDAGEVVSVTIKREFGEEALSTLEKTPEEKKEIEKHINDLFCKGTEVRRVNVGGMIVPSRGSTSFGKILGIQMIRALNLHLRFRRMSLTFVISNPSITKT